MKKKQSTRASRAKTNIKVSFICQILTLVFGFVVPRLYIRAYGSEAYGATSSITQFLAYITLLEGGVAGVARSALYRPLAEGNYEVVGAILGEIKSFFKLVGYVFAGYVVLLACVFKYISNVQIFDWTSTFFLVLAISLSTFAQYFIGITYSVFLYSNQQQYISNIINISTLAINTIAIIILVSLGFNIISVRLISSCIFILRPVLMWIYVKGHYSIDIKNTNSKYLSQKWTAFGQHVAYFLHSNTDIAVLTIFGDLTLVAIYSVYHMVTSAIQNLTSSFSAGMEAVFGDMIAKKEQDLLRITFGKYNTLISSISNILFGTTIVMIVPFVSLYTSGVEDADYIAPLFAMMLVFASYLFCLRLPYHSIIIAAGKFKETRVAAYGEAIINISLSIALVIKFHIIGVAVATVLAVSFRFVYYAVFLQSNILKQPLSSFLKREISNFLNYSAIFLCGKVVVPLFEIRSYLKWAACTGCISLVSIAITMVLNLLFYSSDVKSLVKTHKRSR